MPSRDCGMDPRQEKQLIECARTDPFAFGILYDTYYEKIFNYIFHRLGKADVAADITSDVFYKAMTKLHLFSWKQLAFSAWLYKIANNEIKMYYRKKERKFFSLEFLFNYHGFEIPDSADIERDYIAAEEELVKHTQFKQIQQALFKLPLIYQEILTLRFFEEKSLLEISEITGKNLNTIKSLIARGKDKIKIQLGR